MTTIRKSNTKNGNILSICTPIVFVAMLGIGLASCQSESIDPKQKVSKSDNGKKVNPFADDNNELKPPKEPNPGGGN